MGPIVGILRTGPTFTNIWTIPFISSLTKEGYQSPEIIIGENILSMLLVPTKKDSLDVRVIQTPFNRVRISASLVAPKGDEFWIGFEKENMSIGTIKIKALHSGFINDDTIIIRFEVRFDWCYLEEQSWNLVRPTRVDNMKDWQDDEGMVALTDATLVKS